MNRPTRKQTNQRVRQRVIAKQNIQEQKQKSDLPYSFLIPVVFSNRSRTTDLQNLQFNYFQSLAQDSL